MTLFFLVTVNFNCDYTKILFKFPPNCNDYIRYAVNSKTEHTKNSYYYDDYHSSDYFFA
jgi:hypothetical protein